jgi:ATPase subunit of ABC transporter with duplicated ATPase domains
MPAVTKYIYVMQRVRKAHQDKLILDDVTLAFLPGAKIGVVGPNGAGKSTVLEIMAGLETISNGEAALAPGASVGILLQEPALDPAKDVLGNVEEGVAPTRAMLARFEELSVALGEAGPDELERLLEEYAKVQDAIEAANAWDLDAQLEMAMDALRLPPGDAEVATLSGGERRRVALCRLLLQRPDLLLLDEPTNHLDAESVQWLEQHLAAYAGTVLAVTHDRYFLDNVAGWILELDRGRAYPYEGNYSTYLATKAARLAAEARTSAGRRRVLERELAWIRAGTRGRHDKGRARLRRYDELAAEAERDRPVDLDEIQIPPGPRLGDVVVEAAGLTKGYGDRLLIDDLSFSLPRGRHRRGRRGQRRRQDHPVQADLWPGAAGQGRAAAGPDGAAGLRRPGPVPPRPGPDGVRGHLGRPRPLPGRRPRAAHPGLCGHLRLPWPRPAAAGRGPVRG